MDEVALKKQFAAYLFREPQNPFNAALSVFGEDNIGWTAKAAVEWKDDPIVLEEMKLIEQSSDLSETIANKLQTLRLAWELANTNDPFAKLKEKVDALRLYAEISGYMPDKTVNKNIKVDDDTVSKNVMLVPVHGSNEEWEEDLLKQQARLINEA